MVAAADRTEAVEARDAHARGRVGVRGAAGGRVSDLEAEDPGDGLRVRHQAAAPRSSFSIGHQRAIGSNSIDVSGTSVAPAIRRISASAASSDSRVIPRTSTSSEQCSATTLGRVPPVDHPDVDGHAGPPTVERVQLANDPGRLEDRAAALLRLHAGVRSTAGAPRCAGRGSPFAPRRCRRSRGRIPARAWRPSSGASSRMCGRRGRRADLLVRVGDEHETLERQTAGAAGLRRPAP